MGSWIIWLQSIFLFLCVHAEYFVWCAARGAVACMVFVLWCRLLAKTEVFASDRPEGRIVYEKSQRTACFDATASTLQLVLARVAVVFILRRFGEKTDKLWRTSAREQLSNPGFRAHQH